MLSTACALATPGARAQPGAIPDPAPADPPAALTDRGDDDLAGLLDLGRWRTRSVRLHWANDGTLPNLIDDTDEYFTNGVEIGASFDPDPAPALAERLAPSDRWEDPRFGVGLAIQQRIYTPVDLTRTTPAPGTHPYGGYLGLSAALQRADDDTHDHLGLDIGMVGESSFAEDIQKWIHIDVIPEEIDPRGWGTQIPDELVANVGVARTWKTEPADLGGLGLELLPRVRADAGTMLVRAGVETTLRVGVNLPDDFGPATMLGFTDHTASPASSDEVSFYMFGAVGADLVLHDVFIDGTVFNDDSRSADRESLVHRFRFGAVLRWRAIYAGWTQTFESDRFEKQGGTHAFGEIVLGISLEW